MNFKMYIFQKQKTKSLSLRSEDISGRKSNLKALEKWILTNRETIKSAVNADFGKPLAEVDTTEIFPTLAELRFALTNLNKWSKPVRIDAPLTYLGTTSEIRFEPKGVCLIISPWNFPFLLAIGPLISCIAAGNTAIIKPSEITPNTSRLISKLVSEVFQSDLVSVVEGCVEVTTELLKLNFDHIFFTGSPSVGKIVMKAAAENLASVTLELGGKSPAIIEKSANLRDAARRIAFGKFFNNGQTCIAPDYILIEESIKEKFLSLLKTAISDLFGSEISSSEDYGRIANSNHFERLKTMLEDAEKLGAKIEFGGRLISENRFIEPTLLSNVSTDSKVMEEEIFGPILPIVSYKTEIEAINFVNAKPKPLALYVFSNNVNFRNRVLHNTSAGSVCINECVLQFSHPNLPFGGVNNSGIGKSHGHAGFLAFSNEKPVLIQKKGFALSYLLHPPYTNMKKHIVNLMIRWL